MASAADNPLGNKADSSTQGKDAEDRTLRQDQEPAVATQPNPQEIAPIVQCPAYNRFFTRCCTLAEELALGKNRADTIRTALDLADACFAAYDMPVSAFMCWPRRSGGNDLELWTSIVSEFLFKVSRIVIRGSIQSKLIAHMRAIDNGAGAYETAILISRDITFACALFSLNWQDYLPLDMDERTTAYWLAKSSTFVNVLSKQIANTVAPE